MAKCRFCSAEIGEEKLQCPDCLSLLVETKKKEVKTTKKGKK